MHLVAISGGKICNERTVGNNYKKAIFKEVHEAGHAPQNHCLPKIAPWPLELAASVNSSREDGVSRLSSKINIVPLNLCGHV